MPVEKKSITLQEAAKTALEIQDACNLSGVVFAFAEAMHAICDEANRTNKGTSWKNQHPIVTLFLSKLGSLNGAFFECDYRQASEACEALALVAR